MGSSTRTGGGKPAPVPLSMHPKGGGHPLGGMAGSKGGNGGKKGGKGK